MIPRVFGHPNAEVVEETCQRRGDGVCTFRVCWDSSVDDAARADYFARRARLLEGRLVSRNDTVADLVSTDELDVVLTRIVASAARTVLAPGFVLAIDACEGSSAPVLASGVRQAEAERVAAELRANTDAPGRMVANVASSRRRYGWLACRWRGCRSPSRATPWARWPSASSPSGASPSISRATSPRRSG